LPIASAQGARDAALGSPRNTFIEMTGSWRKVRRKTLNYKCFPEPLLFEATPRFASDKGFDLKSFAIEVRLEKAFDDVVHMCDLDIPIYPEVLFIFGTFYLL
jgi:hypothetical protein